MHDVTIIPIQKQNNFATLYYFIIKNRGDSNSRGSQFE